MVAFDILFCEAHTYSTWQPQPVADQTLRDLYDLLRWARMVDEIKALIANDHSTDVRERLTTSLEKISSQSGDQEREFECSHNS